MKRGALPTSGNQLVDWHFQQVIYFLNNKVDAILVVEKSLIDPESHEAHSGIIIFSAKGRAIIYLSNAKRRHPRKSKMAKTLTHEVIHGLSDDCVKEPSVLRLENILWKLFTKEQKKMIISYLPKHKVKRGPETA